MMKQVCWVFVAVGMLFGMSTSAWGQSPEAQSPEAQRQLIEQVASHIKSVLQADTVLGTPRDFQGTTIVPIVSLLFGFGSGSGTSGEMDEGQGTGAGGGGGVTPSGLLVIGPDGNVQVIAAKKGAFSEFLEAALPAVIDAIKQKKREAERE